MKHLGVDEQNANLIKLGTGLGTGVSAVVIAKSADGVIDGGNALSRLDANPKTIIENNVNVDNDSFTHISDLMKKAESTGWKSPDGSIIWPPNNGIVPHSSFNTTIPVGSRLDRYGGTGDRSSYLAPVDVPVDARALSPDTNLLIRDEYIVLKPLPVIQSKVMPWFGKEGMGIQYETKEATGFTIKQLEELKYIEKVVK
ncbi:MAG: TNT domain-containing protein [Moraxella sp.]|nr:TNT domain-containing protein [Moraxella sp.]